VVIIGFKIGSPVVDISHQLLSQIVTEGSLAIDATAGNGNDTLFLAGLVGETGQVWAFDIQKQAIENTRRRLTEAGMLHRVRLIHGGHEEIDRFVPQKVHAVLFNLGYLPGGDTGIVTVPETTVKALEKSRELLWPGGILCLAVYWGHPGGKEEKEAVEGWAAQLSPYAWDVEKISFPNRNIAPFVMVIQKKCLEA